MIRHVVLLEFAPGTTDAAIAGIVDALREFGATVPSLLRYEVGADLGLSDGNADFAIVADFASVADYETYRDHPEHQRILTELIRPTLATRHAVQFEIG